jgi:hypothetical protein
MGDRGDERFFVMGGAWVFAIATMLDCAGVGDPRYDGGIKFFFA